MKELRKLDQSALTKLLHDKQTELVKLRLDFYTKDVKNVKLIKSLKKEIARINTAISELNFNKERG